MIGAIIAGLITGYGTNTYLNLSLFLAFATVAPDTTFLLFFILPVKAKWMGIAYAAFLVIQIAILFLMTYWPELVLWLPRVLGYELVVHTVGGGM